MEFHLQNSLFCGKIRENNSVKLKVYVKTQTKMRFPEQTPLFEIVFREYWYSDHEMRYCIEELQTKQNAILHELSHIQDERKNDFRRLQLKWMDREEEIRQEYGKRLEKMNE